MQALTVRPSTFRAARATTSGRGARAPLIVRAFFNAKPGAAAEAERKKEEAFQLQQERLAERRASKERIIASQAGIGRNPSKPSAASRAEPPSSKRARAAPVVVEEEEEEPRAPAGNPLAGFLGMLPFGKK